MKQTILMVAAVLVFFSGATMLMWWCAYGHKELKGFSKQYFYFMGVVLYFSGILFCAAHIPRVG